MLTVRAQVIEAEEPVFIPVVSEAYVVLKVWHCAVILQEENELFFWTHILGSSYSVDNSFTNNKKVKLCIAELVKHDHLSSSYWSLALPWSNPSRGREDSVVMIQFILFSSLQTLPGGKTNSTSCTGSQGKRRSKGTLGFFIVICTM